MNELIKKLQLGCWNVGIIESKVEDILNGKPYKIRWMKHSYCDRFFADPFLYKYDSKYYYILAEELKFFEEKGRIVLLTVNKKTMKLTKREPYIDEQYHLSYPNYDESNNCIIPEGYKSGALYSYKIKNDNTLEKTKILDVPLIDPTFVKYNNVEWLFGTTKDMEIDAKQKLSIYYLENGEYSPHKNNPVKVDIKTARPAGKLFFHNGELYRPAQDSSRIYGGQTKIMHVKQLNKETFEEEEVAIVSSKDCKDYSEGLHTFNVYDGFIVVDGYAMKLIFNKIFFVKFPELCKKLSDSNNGLIIENEGK